MVGSGLAGDGSLGTVGVGLVTSFVGPSFGHWYAGDYLTPGVGIRTAGLGLIVYGLYGSQDDLRETPALIGLGIYVGGALYDVVTAPSAVRRWNNTHALTLLPTHLGTGPQASTGFALGGRF